MNHTIDAKGKTLGRVASEAAKYLNGKMSASFERNKKDEIFVSVTNAKSLLIPLKKKTSVMYVRYSGYPGGQTKTRMDKMIEKNGVSELIKIAVRGMLPANKLRPGLLKRLTVSE